MEKTVLRIQLLVLLLLCLNLNAQVYKFSVGSIPVPEEFEGPLIENSSPLANIMGFKKPHKGSDKSTLLQIPTITPPSGIPNLSSEEQEKFAKQYLLQFLGGVERKRSNFKSSEVEIMEISGSPAAKIKWVGKVTDDSLSGVMYCLIHNGSIVSFILKT